MRKTTVRKLPEIRDCHCALCGKVWPDGVEEAIEDGASPDFWIGERNYIDDPVCAACCGSLLWNGSGGEGELEPKPGKTQDVLRRLSLIKRRSERFKAGAARLSDVRRERRGLGSLKLLRKRAASSLKVGPRP